MRVLSCLCLSLALLTVGASQAQGVPEGVSWTLFRIGAGEGGSTVQRQNAPTIRFDAGGRVSGNTGCNAFTGTSRASGAALTFSPLAVTRRACASAVLSALETRFLNALSKTRRVGVSGDYLVLYTSDRTTMTFYRPR